MFGGYWIGNEMMSHDSFPKRKRKIKRFFAWLQNACDLYEEIFDTRNNLETSLLFFVELSYIFSFLCIFYI